MKQVSIDFIIEQIEAGEIFRMLAIDALGKSEMDYEGATVDRGKVYHVEMHQAKGKHVLTFNTEVIEPNVKPLIVNLTAVRGNLSIRKQEQRLIDRLFRYVEPNNRREIITCAIYDKDNKVPNKEGRVQKAHELLKNVYRNDTKGVTILKSDDRCVIFEVEGIFIPNIAKYFNQSVRNEGCPKYLIDWIIDVDLAEYGYFLCKAD